MVGDDHILVQPNSVYGLIFYVIMITLTLAGEKSLLWFTAILANCGSIYLGPPPHPPPRGSRAASPSCLVSLPSAHQPRPHFHMAVHPYDPTRFSVVSPVAVVYPQQKLLFLRVRINCF